MHIPVYAIFMSQLIKNIVVYQHSKVLPCLHVTHVYHMCQDLTHHATWWVWEVVTNLHKRKDYMKLGLKICSIHHIQIGIWTASDRCMEVEVDMTTWAECWLCKIWGWSGKTFSSKFASGAAVNPLKVSTRVSETSLWERL